MAQVRKTIYHSPKAEEQVLALPPIKAPRWMQGFVDFLREQGVIGLTVGLILGVAGKSLVDSIVNNIFNPLIGLLSGGVSLESKTVCLRHAANETCQVGQSLNYGRFLSDLLSFIIVAVLVYFLVKSLKLDKLDIKNKE